MPHTSARARSRASTATLTVLFAGWALGGGCKPLGSSDDAALGGAHARGGSSARSGSAGAPVEHTRGTSGGSVSHGAAGVSASSGESESGGQPRPTTDDGFSVGGDGSSGDNAGGEHAAGNGSFAGESGRAGASERGGASAHGGTNASSGGELTSGGVNSQELTCGDGIVSAPREQCDDRNFDTGDGCDASCQIEAGWSCGDGACWRAVGDAQCSAHACRFAKLCVEQPSGIACSCPAVGLSDCSGLVFASVGLLPDAESCTGTAVSADGETVVGKCSGLNDVGSWAYRFFAATGTAPFAIADQPTTAVAVNTDGSIIAGNAGDDPSAFRWRGSESDRLTAPALATDMDGPGAVVVGNVLLPPARQRGFRWDPLNGYSTLEALLDEEEVWIRGVSADGQIAVGGTSLGGLAGAAFWLASSSEPQSLPTPDPISETTAVATDGTGTLIIGDATYADEHTGAIVWVRDTGTPRVLALPARATWATVAAISADGLTIVGNSDLGAVVWIGSSTRLLADILEAGGADMSNWKLEASDVSANGGIVVGTGYYQIAHFNAHARAFRAFLKR